MGSIYLLVGGLSRCANLALHHQPVTFRNFLGAWQNLESISVICFVLIVLIYTLSWWFKVPLLTRFLFFSGLISGVVWLILSAQRYFQIVQLPGEMFLLPLQFLTAAALLGAVHSGMWFGHWYLVVPDLPVVYLKRFNTVLLCTLSGVTLLLCLNLFFRQQATDVVSFNLFYQIIFSMRVSYRYRWYVVPLLHYMGLFTSEICRPRCARGDTGCDGLSLYCHHHGTSRRVLQSTIVSGNAIYLLSYSVKRFLFRYPQTP